MFKENERIHTIIKICFAVILVSYALFLCLSDRAKDVSVNKITSYMTKNADLTDMEECHKTELMRYYHLQEGDMQGYFFYKSPSPMSVDEILIVKCSSKAEASTILESMQSHLKSQKDIFDGYGTDQMGILKNAIVKTKGNYAIYMCGNNAAKWQQLFLSLI